MGKVIYESKGKAAEYSKHSFSAYVGCSNLCEYCYCKKGAFKHAMGQGKPQLKKCFKDESHALEVFEKELKANLPELQKHGLFFTFTSDPFLPETMKLNSQAMAMAAFAGIPVKALTKVAISTEGLKRMEEENLQIIKDKIAFGFTLTGHDE
jgi:DNA repair photolyase